MLQMQVQGGHSHFGLLQTHAQELPPMFDDGPQGILELLSSDLRTLLYSKPPEGHPCDFSIVLHRIVSPAFVWLG